ncbi:lipase secretion chaperone [Chitinimonas sp. BJB300]|uniref:lipase secretion chaperone n=1 Tax=Chitinimonas sp. BJB300 TaxID=1559339 RepID=UPI0011811F38|nr:lipase secretion chaperone [Chitinimonas sp. BJB300]
MLRPYVLISVATVLVIAWLAWPAGHADAPVDPLKVDGLQAKAAPAAGGFPAPAILSVGPTEPDWTQPSQRIAALRATLAGKRSLPGLREEIRKGCNRGCEDWPEGDLAALTPPEANLIRRALAAQPAMEQAIASLVQDAHQPLAERLARIDATRNAVAGQDVTQLLYGEDQARLAFQAAAQDFIAKQAAATPTASRRQILDDLRRQHYGSYYDRLSAEEGPEQHLYWALAATEAGVTPAQRTEVRLKLRTEYLGASLAQQLAAQDADDMHHQQQAQGYQAARAALEADIRNRGNPEQNPALAIEQQDRLTELRLKWLPS